MNLQNYTWDVAMLVVVSHDQKNYLRQLVAQYSTVQPKEF